MGISMALYVAGAFFIPENLDIFTEINDMPLFTWLRQNRGALPVAFWIYLLLVVMALLVVNIVGNGYVTLVAGIKGRRYLQVIPPQVLHVGVVLVLFGHMVSAVSGYKQDVPIKLHEKRIVRGHVLELVNLESLKIEGEDSTRWRVGLVIDGKAATLEPAQPAFIDTIGYFAKSASENTRSALIGLVSDPGMGWEIAGAVCFILGALGLFVMQYRKGVA